MDCPFSQTGSEHVWIPVAAALIQREGRYLLSQRHGNSHLGGLWEFPGGKQEAGESLEQCLRRELLEELGIEIGVPELVFTQRYLYLDRAVELFFFSCSILQGEPRPLGCAAVRWVRPDDFHLYEFPPADAAILDKIIQGHE
ncbi:MAG: (deoxy)nucleoside triphosphate pyrophosphohydrolase [Nitrospirae bacterium]|nr:MAG: (deoxy)nucleoside triphosphate pyrophosphohydrolase [Nitrospirota bacterium]